MRRASRAGTTLVGTVLAASLAIVVLGAGLRLVQSHSNLAESADAGDTAARRTERVLVAFEDAVRSGSLAQFTHVDGTAFTAGTSDDGVSGKRAVGYRGAPILSARFKIWWAPDASGTSGDVLRSQGGVTEVVAHGVDRFRVTRSAGAFTASVTSRVTTNGTFDRAVRGSATQIPRNP